MEYTIEFKEHLAKSLAGHIASSAATGPYSEVHCVVCGRVGVVAYNYAVENPGVWACAYCNTG